jgi:hypothetical protein
MPVEPEMWTSLFVVATAPGAFSISMPVPVPVVSMSTPSIVPAGRSPCG